MDRRFQSPQYGGSGGTWGFLFFSLAVLFWEEARGYIRPCSLKAKSCKPKAVLSPRSFGGNFTFSLSEGEQVSSAWGAGGEETTSRASCTQIVKAAFGGDHARVESFSTHSWRHTNGLCVSSSGIPSCLSCSQLYYLPKACSL